MSKGYRYALLIMVSLKVPDCNVKPVLLTKLFHQAKKLVLQKKNIIRPYLILMHNGYLIEFNIDPSDLPTL